MLRILGKLLIWLGAAGFCASTAWWYVFFEQVLGENVKRASECFYHTTAKCSVGHLLGTFGEIPSYSPVSMWVSVGVFSAGMLGSALLRR